MIKLDTKGVALLLAAAIGAVWYLRKQKLFDVTSADNPINQSAESAYNAVTGSEDAPGADLYDVLHEDSANPWGWYNPLYYLTEALDAVTGVK